MSAQSANRLSRKSDPSPPPLISLAARVIAATVRLAGTHPVAALALYLVVLVASAIAAAGLQVDTDSSRMLNPKLDFQARILALREAFPDRKTSIVIVVRADQTDAADAVSAELAANLTGREGIAEVFAPATDPFFLTHGALWLETDELDRQLRRISASSNLIAGLRADPTPNGYLATLDQMLVLAARAGDTAALEPVFAETEAVFRATTEGKRRAFGWSSAFSGTTGPTDPVLRTVTVTPALDYTALSPAGSALASIRQVVFELNVPESVEIGVTGEPALRQEELRTVAEGVSRSLGLSLLLVAVALWLALRTLGRVLLGLGSLAATLVLSAGFAAISVGGLNLISIAFVVLMAGLGIDFAIHFMAHLDEKTQNLGKRTVPSSIELLTGAARSIGPALALTAASTSVAFLAFTVTDFYGMAQLGLIGGAGVLIAFFVAITLIPAVVSLRPALAAGRPRGHVPTLLSGGQTFPRIMAAVGLVCAFIAIESRFDADPMELRDPDAPSVRTYDWLTEDPDRSPLYASVMVEGAENARRIAAKAREIDGVAKATWLGSLIPDDQDAKLDLLDLAWPSLEHAAQGEQVSLTPDSPAGDGAQIKAGDLSALADRLDNPAEGTGSEGKELASALRDYAQRRTPASDTRLEQNLFAYFPLFTDRLATMLDIDRVSAETLPAPLVRPFVSDDLYRIDIHPQADIREPAARTEFVATVLRDIPNLTGATVQIEGARIAVSLAMLQAVALALLGAGLICFATLNSARGTLAILVPVALAGAVCMAAGVVLDLPFNFANVIVLPLIIGIGVDGGIHLALRARQTAAVFATSTPMAAFYSALTTVAAFGTLGLSDHRGTASMGILLAIGLTATVAMSFALTPVLARWGMIVQIPTGNSSRKSAKENFRKRQTPKAR